MKSNPRVLFVGHDPADASLLELVLARDLPSAKVVHISDPVSFGRESERADFDLVVCDERLDWTDGTGLLLEVGRRHPAVPVVILSQETQGRQPGAGPNLLATRLDKSSASVLKLPEILSAALKRAAKERRQARIEPRIRNLLERSRVGVFRCSLSGQLLDADETFLDILGARSLEEAQQLDVAELTPQLPRGFTKTGKLYKREQSLSGMDGRLIRVALTELVNLDDQGMPVLDGLLEEIGEPRETRSDPRKEAAGSAEDMRRFSSLVAHELKEPLRSVEQSTRMMLEDSEGKLGQAAEESADLVVAGVRRLRSLIESLMTLARSGGDEESVQSCDCNDLVNEVLETLRDRVEESQAIVTVNPLPTVRADPNQLGLVFRNLLSNAVKFHGEKPPSVEVAACQDGENWIFSIRDDGVGIEPGVTEESSSALCEAEMRQGRVLGWPSAKTRSNAMVGVSGLNPHPAKGRPFTSLFHFSPLARAVVAVKPLKRVPREKNPRPELMRKPDEHAASQSSDGRGQPVRCPGDPAAVESIKRAEFRD